MTTEQNLNEKHEILIYELKQILEVHNQKVELSEIKENPNKNFIVSFYFTNIVSISEYVLQEVTTLCRNMKITFVHFHSMEKNLILQFYTNQMMKDGHVLIH